MTAKRPNLQEQDSMNKKGRGREVRTLLMVDSGDGKVRCVTTVPAILPSYFLTAKAWAKDRMVTRFAARWWLVEAENADAARRKIMFLEHTDGGTARILASGGNGG